MPALSNDLWLLILSNLNFRDLHAVAKCSRRFKKLAQIACAESTEGQNQHECYSRSTKQQSIEMLNIFVADIRHFNDHYFLKEFVQTVHLWQRLDVRQMKSLIITTTTFDYIFGANRYKRPLVSCFPSLLYLKVVYDGFTDFEEWRVTKDINFSQVMPKLKKLDMKEVQPICRTKDSYPRKLESIKIVEQQGYFENYLRLNSNLTEIVLDQDFFGAFGLFSMYAYRVRCVELLIECGLQKQLKRLECLFNFEKKSFQLLTEFRCLKKLKLYVFAPTEWRKDIEYIRFFRALDQLEHFGLSNTHVSEFERDPNELLMTFVKNIPPRLKEFSFVDWSPIYCIFDWKKCVAALPSTCKSRFAWQE